MSGFGVGRCVGFGRGVWGGRGGWAGVRVGGGGRGVSSVTGMAGGAGVGGGWEWVGALVGEVREGVDPWGENGEFQWFAWAGPMLEGEIRVEAGERVERDGLVYAEMVQGRAG